MKQFECNSFATVDDVLNLMVVEFKILSNEKYKTVLENIKKMVSIFTGKTFKIDFDVIQSENKDLIWFDIHSDKIPNHLEKQKRYYARSEFKVYPDSEISIRTTYKIQCKKVNAERFKAEFLKK